MGTQGNSFRTHSKWPWIPAFAGMNGMRDGLKSQIRRSYATAAYRR